MNKQNTIAALSCFLLILIFGANSFAIPTWARKYNTSCVTCHSPFPRLNPFGEAFRINGYKYPQNDEEKVKEEPLQLSSESYKKVWPNAVWPNSIPAVAPISIRAREAFEATTVGESTTAEFTPPALQLLASANIGENMTAFVGAHLYENAEPGSIDRLYLRFNNLFSDKLLNIQVGQFIPELVPFATNHRGLTNSAYAFNTYDPGMDRSFITTHVHGAGAFGIEAFQLGVEANGIVKKRLRYVLGLVNGSGAGIDINAEKDFYGRLSYKIGGMAFDGTLKEGVETDKETSFALGVFGYKGIGTEKGENYDFFRAGTDINFYFLKSNIVGGFITGANGPEEYKKYDLLFAEINYQMYPWLTGVLRYEQARPYSMKSFSQVVPHLSALIVANVKVRVESRIDPENLVFDNLHMGFEFAF